MIIDLCNDDIDQRKCPKKFLTKARGFIPKYGQKSKKYTVLIEIIVFPSLHLNKNASLLMIRNDVFTGTVSASTPLSTQLRFVIVIICKFKTLKKCAGIGPGSI